MDKPAQYKPMAPIKAGEGMERVDLRIPRPTLELIDELADENGIDRSAMLRQIIDEGLPIVLQQKSAELEYRNKRLVNRKLKLSIAQLESPELP